MGPMISTRQEDRDALVAKATIELLNRGEKLEVATQRLQELWDLMEMLL